MADNFQSQPICDHCGDSGFTDSYPQFAFGSRSECKYCLNAGRTTIESLYKEGIERRLKNKIDPDYCIESHFIGHLRNMKL